MSGSKISPLLHPQLWQLLTATTWTHAWVSWTLVVSLGDQAVKWWERVCWLFCCTVIHNCCLCRNWENQTESSNDLFNHSGWLCCVECGNRRQEWVMLVVVVLWNLSVYQGDTWHPAMHRTSLCGPCSAGSFCTGCTGISSEKKYPTWIAVKNQAWETRSLALSLLGVRSLGVRSICKESWAPYCVVFSSWDSLKSKASKGEEGHEPKKQVNQRQSSCLKGRKLEIKVAGNQGS